MLRVYVFVVSYRKRNDVIKVVTGVSKKLHATGKKKGCQKIALWARSISNHLYWCAASSHDDPQLIVLKWKSILNHIANAHEGHDKKFPHCERGDIDERAWMVPGMTSQSTTAPRSGLRRYFEFL